MSSQLFSLALHSDSNQLLLPSSQISNHSVLQQLGSASRRLTRSTYVGDPNAAEPSARHKRSPSTDSENGWIPPPPLLPLDTHFLITNVPPSCSSPPAALPTSLPTDLSFAHLRCPAPQPCSAATLQPMFRLLVEGELPAPKRIRSGEEAVGQEARLAEAITRRHRGPEILEKRMKRREKERLVHEHFKLQAHLALLRNPSGTDWKSVRALALRRIKEEESTGAMDVSDERESEKVDRMRWVLVREAQETLERYEKLLNTRKQPKSKAALLPSDQSPHLLESQSSAPPRSGRRRKPTSPFRDLPTPTRPLHITVKLKPPDKRSEGDTQTRRHSLLIAVDQQENEEMDKGTEESLSDWPEMEDQRLAGADPPVSLRESLYDSPDLRRTILEDGSRRRGSGRVSYAFGSRVPELGQIKWGAYGLGLESFALAHGLGSSPFKLDSITHRQRPSRKYGEDAKDWVEFNPLINEERALVERQDEYGQGSRFFELTDELESVEEEMEARGEGPSIRKLMAARVGGSS